MNKKAFTLIELLVVISIVSLLSSVIFASLNSARAKGNDAKIKSQLASLRSGAEIYRDINNNSFASGTVTNCTTAGTMFMDTNSGIRQILEAISTTKDCGAVASAYAVAATLPSGLGTGAWCVDSTGVSRDRTAAGVLYSGLTGLNGAKTAAGATVCR